MVASPHLNHEKVGIELVFQRAAALQSFCTGDGTKLTLGISCTREHMTYHLPSYFQKINPCEENSSIVNGSEQ